MPPDPPTWSAAMHSPLAPQNFLQVLFCPLLSIFLNETLPIELNKPYIQPSTFCNYDLYNTVFNEIAGWKSTGYSAAKLWTKDTNMSVWRSQIHTLPHYERVRLRQIQTCSEGFHAYITVPVRSRNRQGRLTKRSEWVLWGLSSLQFQQARGYATPIQNWFLLNGQSINRPPPLENNRAAISTATCWCVHNLWRVCQRVCLYPRIEVPWPWGSRKCNDRHHQFSYVLLQEYIVKVLFLNTQNT